MQQSDVKTMTDMVEKAKEILDLLNALIVDEASSERDETVMGDIVEQFMQWGDKPSRGFPFVWRFTFDKSYGFEVRFDINAFAVEKDKPTDGLRS